MITSKGLCSFLFRDKSHVKDSLLLDYVDKKVRNKITELLLASRWHMNVDIAVKTDKVIHAWNFELLHYIFRYSTFLAIIAWTGHLLNS